MARYLLYPWKPLMLAARADGPIKSIEDLIAQGKQKQLTYSSNNVTN